MALTNKPNKSKYQVGETVFFLSDIKTVSAIIRSVSSLVTDPLNDSTGKQENIYYLEGFIKEFKEDELFHSANALLYYLKGDYLNKWKVTQMNLNNIDIGTDLSYSDFSNIDFINIEALNFQQSLLQGCNFTNAILTGCDLSNCKMQNSNLTNATIASANFSGANLTGAILTHSKDEFKLEVGLGNWTGTVWVDGTILT